MFLPLSGLDDYHAQYVHFMYEKWKTYDIFVEGITYATQATLECMCYGVCAILVLMICGTCLSL